MTSDQPRAPLSLDAGYLRALTLYVNGRKVLDCDLLTQRVVDTAAVAAVLQAAWPQRRTVTAREIEIWQALGGIWTGSAVRPV